jgi:ribosome-associated toxin RatA of RatAB toxin-antitoxin module
VTHIARSALVPYTPHEMFALVADIPSYPGFLPWCGGARILSQDEDLVVASIDIAYHGVHKTFTTRNRLQRDKVLEVSLVEGPFKHLHGNWLFDAVGADASRVVFNLDFEVANRLMAMVISPVFTGIANQMVDSFVARARAVYGPRAVA